MCLVTWYLDPYPTWYIWHTPPDRYLLIDLFSRDAFSDLENLSLIIYSIFLKWFCFYLRVT